MEFKRLKHLIEFLLLIVSFVVFAYLVQSNLTFFEYYFDFGILGMGVFIIILIASIVLAPISSLPLFPLASAIWGWKISAILITIGWTLGEIIAFLIARKYGISLVSKFIPVSNIQFLEKWIPKEHLFWSVVFIRMIMPVDGISYFLGLFSKMKLKTYILSTVLGTIPFAIMISYLGIVPFQYQLLFFLVVLIIVLLGLIINVYRKEREKRRLKS